MTNWSEKDMAVVLAAAADSLTVVKSTGLFSQVGDVFQFEVSLRNGQRFSVNVAEKGKKC